MINNYMERVVPALLTLFAPFISEKIKIVPEKEKIIDLTKKNQLEALYKEPVICMLRIKIYHISGRQSWSNYLMLLKKCEMMLRQVAE